MNQNIIYATRLNETASDLDFEDFIPIPPLPLASCGVLGKSLSLLETHSHPVN